jgi:hypothetical protein
VLLVLLLSMLIRMDIIKLLPSSCIAFDWSKGFCDMFVWL